MEIYNEVDCKVIKCLKDSEDEIKVIRLLEINMYDYDEVTDETDNKINVFYIYDADAYLEEHLAKL